MDRWSKEILTLGGLFRLYGCLVTRGDFGNLFPSLVVVNLGGVNFVGFFIHVILVVLSLGGFGGWSRKNNRV